MKRTKQVNVSLLSKSLEKNISLLEEAFRGDETLTIRRFQNKYLSASRFSILYLENMVNAEVLNENIIQPILDNNLAMNISHYNLLEELQYKVIATNNVKNAADLNTIVTAIITGNTVLFVEGYSNALLISTKGWKSRSITEPESAKLVRGPKEGFTESLLMNISMVRRRITVQELKFKFREIGEKTNTKICVCYIEGVVLESIVEEVEKRLDNITIDGIIDSAYIQELIRDEPLSPFDTVGSSERPDVIAAKLLEGRVAIFTDGSPFVLTVPFLFIENVQINEDYYNDFLFGSINRLMRSASAILAVTIPALYLSFVTFHQELLPTALLLSIASSRRDIPFPTSLSLFVMLFIFDILREAGTRMPTPIGQAVNIVGTLVLGQAAVEARLVSAPVIIVTALTGILTLMNINLIGATILSRFYLLLVTSVFGIYGLIFGFLLIIIHLMSIRSFGVSYMLNTTSYKNHSSQDTWVRLPWWTMTMRPKIVSTRNMVRQSVKKRKVKDNRESD